MVNKIILEYLRINRSNYNLEDLKRKILSAGYSQKDINEALAQLNAQSQGNTPSVNTTINKINKINIPLNQTKKPVRQITSEHKPIKWIWIVLGILIILLVILGGLIWWFWDKLAALFA